MRHRQIALSGNTVTFTLNTLGDKQTLFIFVEDDEGAGVLQTFELNASFDLAVLESLIAFAKEAA